MAAAPEAAQLKAAKTWLKQQHPPGQKLIKGSMVLGALAALLMVAQAAVLAKVSHLVIFEAYSFNDVSHYLLYFLALVLAKSCLNWFSQRLAARGANLIQQNVRQALYSKLTTGSSHYIEQNASAKLSNTLIDGVDALADYYSGYLPAVAYSGIIPLAILAVALPLDWQSAIILFLCAPVIPFFMIMIGKKAQSLNQQRWQELTRLSQRFLDRIRGMAQLKLFNATTSELILVSQATDQFRRSTLSVLKVAFLSSLALEFLASISIAMVAVTVGFRLLWGELDFFTGFFILLLAPEFFLPLRQMGTQYHARMQGVAAAQEMMDIFDQPSESVTHSNDPHNDANTPSAAPLALTIRDLSYTYPRSKNTANTDSDKPALSELNMAFNGPGLYALVGASGAGKSTLFDVLLGFNQPNQGAVLVTIGEQTRSLAVDDIAWVPQKPKLFASSIIRNLDPSLGLNQTQHLNESVYQRAKSAAKMAHADEFICQQPKAYDQRLGENGEGLSGGQQQRLALARAFYKGAPVLLLDEPSAHLDTESERYIQTAIDQYAKDHIVIVIAHRLHTIQAANNILVLEQGRLVEQGDFASLNQSGTRFYQQIQANLLTQSPATTDESPS